MASENIHQIFIANPITSNAATDLMYMGQSPYGAGNDVAITYANFAKQFSINNWVDETGASVTMAANTGYTSDDGASLVTFTLPATSNIGDWVEITGKGSGGWTIAQAAGQQIQASGVGATTLGVGGSLSSAHQYDCVKLRCLTANTLWTVVSQQSQA